MKIVITGGLGFVGSHLADFLVKQNHKIILVTKGMSKKDNISHISKKIHIEKLDISKYTYKNKSTNYNLYSTINHYGNILGGHYVNFSKRNDKWYIFDDTNCHDVPNDDIIHKNS